MEKSAYDSAIGGATVGSAGSAMVIGRGVDDLELLTRASNRFFGDGSVGAGLIPISNARSESGDSEQKRVKSVLSPPLFHHHSPQKNPLIKPIMQVISRPLTRSSRKFARAALSTWVNVPAGPADPILGL